MSSKKKQESHTEEEEDQPTNDNNQPSKSKKKKKKNKKKKKKHNTSGSAPTRNPNLMADIQERIKRTIEVINDPDWKLEKTTKDVKIYRLAPKDEIFHKVKGVTEVPCSAKEMAQMQEDIETNLPLADTMCQKVKILKRLDDVTRVCYAAFKSPGRPLVSDRDFIFVDTAATQGEYHFSIAFSVDEEEYGVTVDDPVPGCVRAVIMETGYMWKEIRENVIECTYVVQADPKGWIPTWVVNFVATEQAMNVCRVREYFENMKNEEGSDASSKS